MVFGNYSAKDKFNSIGSQKLSDVIAPIVIVGMEIESRPDKDGVITDAATIKAEDGALYGTVSAVVIKQLEAIGQMFEEGTKSVTVTITHRTSGNGRDYILLEMQ